MTRKVATPFPKKLLALKANRRTLQYPNLSELIRAYTNLSERISVLPEYASLVLFLFRGRIIGPTQGHFVELPGMRNRRVWFRLFRPGFTTAPPVDSKKESLYRAQRHLPRLPRHFPITRPGNGTETSRSRRRRLSPRHAVCSDEKREHKHYMFPSAF